MDGVDVLLLCLLQCFKDFLVSEGMQAYTEIREGTDYSAYFPAVPLRQGLSCYAYFCNSISYV